MLYIHPGECVDCGACEPVCPVEAIFYEDDVPGQWAQFTAENAKFFGQLGSRPRQRWPSARPSGSPGHFACEQVTGMGYRLVVRLTPADVGKRVVIRWRPGPGDSKQMTDVLGILEQADAGSFAVRTRDGRLVVIPTGRALAGKVVPPPPAPRRRAAPKPP